MNNNARRWNMLIEDVPDDLADEEFGGQPSGGAVVWAGAAIVVGIAVAVALLV